jgi:hypothetical protein
MKISRENYPSLLTILNECMTHFNHCQNLSIVKNVTADDGIVIPIPWFGDSDAFFDSKLKIVTVGLNPSGIEFRKSRDKREKSINGKWQKRFSIVDTKYSVNQLKKVLDSYFDTNPYMDWFDNFEYVLKGANASYFKNENKHTALHLDFCSPIATEPTWSKLGAQNKKKPKTKLTRKQERDEKSKLTVEGQSLFNRTLEILAPDIIIFGVGYGHLKKSKFEFLKSGEIIFYESTTSASGNETKKIVRVHRTETHGKVELYANGSAFNKPFGNYTPQQMERAGQLIVAKYKPTA